MGSCGFFFVGADPFVFDGLKPKTFSPVIFQADVRVRLMKDGRGGYGGSKIPDVNDYARPSP